MTPSPDLAAAVRAGDLRALARAITLVEAGGSAAARLLESLPSSALRPADIVGLTGAPGVGKSSLLDRLIEHYQRAAQRVGVLAVDPSSAVHGGAILGDRIRWMRHALSPHVVIRSMASRGSLGGLGPATAGVLRLMAAAGCRPIFLETVGVGQIGSDVRAVAGIVLALTAPGLGDDIQLMKAGILDAADLVVLNKADLPGADAVAAALQAELEHRRRPLVTVSAAAGAGIDPLVTAIEELRARAAAAPLNHRPTEEDVVDRALELLRPHLRSRLAGVSADLAPEARARQLAAAFAT